MDEQTYFIWVDGLDKPCCKPRIHTGYQQIVEIFKREWNIKAKWGGLENVAVVVGTKEQLIRKYDINKKTFPEKESEDEAPKETV